ncbi:hypothetical protein KBC86_02085 [Candidatus Gracilibacteria bacterium]|nr:hypothetical protein [Candidatus Gracilibacteria bacterium]
MLISDLKSQINSEVLSQFQAIYYWINDVGEILDVTNPNQILSRKNFLIIAIYSANEYIVEHTIELFFSKIYDKMETEQGSKMYIDYNRGILKRIINNNHSGKIISNQEMLAELIGSVDSKRIFSNIKSKLASDYDLLSSELGMFKGFRDSIAHSSVKFFTDAAGSQLTVYPNSDIINRLKKLEGIWILFCECLYDELGLFYRIP